MNENINLCEILKDCQKGEKLYATFLGDVKFVDIINETILVESWTTKIYHFFSDGRYELNGELVLFPSRDQRDWSKFVPLSKRFNPKEFKPFDKVLAKNRFSSKWTCTFFSYTDNNVSFPVYCSGGYFKVCIPYNEETKHLIGTNEDCPEYYKWWEK